MGGEFHEIAGYTLAENCRFCFFLMALIFILGLLLKPLKLPAQFRLIQEILAAGLRMYNKAAEN